MLGIFMMAKRGTSTHVVHRKPLIDQWCNRISSFLNIPLNEIGKLGGGKDKVTNVIDAAMLLSLDRQG